MSPHKEGKLAAKKEKGVLSCPYLHGSIQHQQWIKGYDEQEILIRELSPPKSEKAWGKWLKST